jgi:hypothetical protein
MQDNNEEETEKASSPAHSPQKGNLYGYKLDVQLKQVCVHKEDGAIYDIVTFMEEATEPEE